MKTHEESTSIGYSDALSILILLISHTRPLPMRKPHKEPMTSCPATSSRAIPKLVSKGFSTMPISVVVRIYAMGSLLPLSSSRVGFRLCFRLSPCDRSIEKTEAESVDDIVAANRKDAIKPILGTLSPKGVLSATSQTSNPVEKVISNTPAVANVRPCPKTGLISSVLVSIPPENKMIHNAIVLTIWATWSLSKCKPKPSEPNTIPTTRKSNNTGTPSLLPILLTNMLAKNNTDITSKNNSICIFFLLGTLLVEVYCLLNQEFVLLFLIKRTTISNTLIVLFRVLAYHDWLFHFHSEMLLDKIYGR